jgi:LacI family transcriptional regulator
MNLNDKSTSSTTIDKPRPSIDHVASLANVSRVTVARVFSSPSLVAKKTKDKVLKASRMLKYRSNPLARGLAGGRTNTIGVLWKFSSNPAAPEITGKIAVQLQEKGYMSHISSFTADFDSTLEVLSEYAERRIEGVVIQAVDDWLLHKEFKDLLSQFRAVVLDTDELKPLPFDQVVRDRLGGYKDVAKHFVKCGRKRPFLIGAGGNIGDKKKCDAFVNQLQDSGLTIQQFLPVLENNDNYLDIVLSGLEKEFSNTTFPYDAIMCMSDDIAMCVMSCLIQKGLKVPDDVAVVGFNDILAAKHLKPSLASVNRQTENAVFAIERLLINRLENPEGPIQHEEIPMEFVWRESAG